jgi:hypothetical protein
VADRRLLIACISSSVLGILLSAFIHSSWSSVNLYSDISSFWGRTWLSTGQVPYASSELFEYPPISGLVLYAARVIGGAISGVAGGDYAGYYLAFSALSLAAAAVMGWSTWRLGRAVGTRVNPAYFLFPTIVVYGIYNFDLFNALFIVLSLQLFLERRRDLSSVFLGLALATKLVAVVLIPVYLSNLPDWRSRFRYLAASLVVGGAFFVPIAVANFGFFGQFISFYRGWGLEDAWYIWIFGDPFSSAAKVFGLVLLALLLLRVYTLKMPLLQQTFLALSAYLLSTSLYAPQFNVMLIPLLAVLALSSPFVFSMDVFNALIILTWFTVPAGPGYGPTYAWTVPQLMALLRTASLALLSVSIASGAGHSPFTWIRLRLGIGGGVQTRLPSPEDSGHSLEISDDGRRKQG